MIGDAFRAKRKNSGLTQTEVAGKLFVGQSMVAQVEAGIKMPTVGMVKLAAELFGCTTDALIFDGQPPDGGAYMGQSAQRIF